jgi:hypothetical protein
VLFAQKAPNKYTRPRLVLDFSNILHKDDLRSPLYAHVLDVDNARETIQNNEILGIIQPHASTKVSIALVAVSVANPFAGYAIKGVQTVYGLSIRREIVYPAGTDLQVQIVRYSKLKQKPAWSGWAKLPVDQDLQHLVTNAPMRTTTPGKVPSDPTNLMFIGSQQELMAAFTEAGWLQASDLNVKSAMKTATATLRQTGYNDAPVSTLHLQGKAPDIVFQKSLNTFAKRHHLRIWQLKPTYQGRRSLDRRRYARHRHHQRARWHQMVSSHRSAHRSRTRLGRNRFVVHRLCHFLRGSRSSRRTQKPLQRHGRHHRDRWQNFSGSVSKNKRPKRQQRTPSPNHTAPASSTKTVSPRGAPFLAGVPRFASVLWALTARKAKDLTCE